MDTTQIKTKHSPNRKLIFHSVFEGTPSIVYLKFMTYVQTLLIWLLFEAGDPAARNLDGWD